MVRESISVGTDVKNLVDKEILLAYLLLIVTMFIANCNELRMKCLMLQSFDEF